MTREIQPKDFYVLPETTGARMWLADEVRCEGPADDGMRDRIAVRFERERGGWAIWQAQVEDGPYVEVAFVPFKVKR